MRGASAAKGLKFAKPEKRATTKAKRDKARAAHIAEIRRQVFARDKFCRICYRLSQDMHEIVPRSKTRGLSNEIRFSLANCIGVCRECHERITRHQYECSGDANRLTVTILDDSLVTHPVRLGMIRSL
jgi:hypothetical protein